jgi:D-tagatose-1,6-bisphosphate aldolase subunit GatZ/KbaZ
MRTHPLKELVSAQKQGLPRGIYSVCSANEYVIKAALLKGKRENRNVLIESTSNQVNQFGGYTGMKPGDFVEFIYGLAREIGLDKEKVILGGDHLGPNPWKEESSKEAMKKAVELVRQYVLAGYTKIHLDASMYLGDDQDKSLPPGVIAERAARLCLAAEEAFKEVREDNPQALHPVYVIGTEVPVPGGTQSDDDQLSITEVADFKETVKLSREAFISHGLTSAWDNVIAVVVQPGVEFGNREVVEYDRRQAAKLSQELKKYDNLVFEGHSTDYQTPAHLKEMVEDGIAILKVGPALTFAVREALFALAWIEKELYRYDRDVTLSNFIEVLDMEMLDNPENWNKYYQGKEKEVRLDRKYSFSDRSRYYYATPAVTEALKQLLANLKRKEIPLSMISQYLPRQYRKLREGLLDNQPEAFILGSVVDVLDQYSYAVIPEQTSKVGL